MVSKARETDIATVSDPLSLLRYPVFDADGTELGEIAGVYLDRGSGEPEWAALWLPGGRVTVVPLADAELYEDSVTVPFTMHQVERAPCQRDELVRELSEEEEAELYRYYSEGESAVTAAREAATDAVETATKQAKRVASTAKDEGKQVASKAKKQAKRVASTAKDEGQDAVQSAAGQASQARQDAVRVAHEAAGEAQGVLEGLRGFVRHRPGVFLVGSALAGIAGGRFLRSALGQDRGAPEEEHPEEERREEESAPSVAPIGAGPRRRPARASQAPLRIDQPPPVMGAAKRGAVEAPQLSPPGGRARRRGDARNAPVAAAVVVTARRSRRPAPRR